MKKFTIIFGLVLLINFPSYCQLEYDSIMSESKVWSNLSGGYGIEMVECCHATTFMKIEIDPFINTIDEKQILASSDSLQTWTKIGNIRENDKKIYFRDLDNNQGLIYDFGASVGDILKIVNYAQEFDIDTIVVRVEDIDTIDYLGVERQRFQVQDTLHKLTDYWITGIGSVKGLLDPCIVLAGGFRELLCVHDNEIQIYQNTDRMTCYLDNSTGVNKYDTKEFSVFPNPSTGSINIDLKEINSDLTYSIINSSGQLIECGKVKGKNMNVCLDPGFYFVTIKDKNKLIFEEKIVIVN